MYLYDALTVLSHKANSAVQSKKVLTSGKRLLSFDFAKQNKYSDILTRHKSNMGYFWLRNTLEGNVSDSLTEQIFDTT